jgi:hypothetical protein
MKNYLITLVFLMSSINLMAFHKISLQNSDNQFTLLLDTNFLTFNSRKINQKIKIDHCNRKIINSLNLEYQNANHRSLKLSNTNNTIVYILDESTVETLPNSPLAHWLFQLPNRILILKMEIEKKCKK